MQLIQVMKRKKYNPGKDWTVWSVQEVQISERVAENIRLVQVMECETKHETNTPGLRKSEFSQLIQWLFYYIKDVRIVHSFF